MLSLLATFSANTIDSTVLVPSVKKSAEEEALEQQQQQQQQQQQTATIMNEEISLFSNLGSFLKSLLFSEELKIDAKVTNQPIDHNWQANYLSPVHTKPIKEGKISNEKEKEKTPQWYLKNHFKGVLPYYRVWELKTHEMNADTPVIGRGTPPRPNLPIFKREMSATKLFLKDYQKRRGLKNDSGNISEEVMEVKQLKRDSSFNTAESISKIPEALITRRKGSPRSSRLVN